MEIESNGPCYWKRKLAKIGTAGDSKGGVENPRQKRKLRPRG